jgi:TonB family protein
MYFNFDDLHPDTPRLERGLSPLEQAFLTLLVYASLVTFLFVWPHLPFVKAWTNAQQQTLEQQRLKELRDMRDRAQFVFVSPKVDIRAKVPPKLAELSDQDRKAQTMERAPDPKNDLPYSRGNSAERVIEDAGKRDEQPAEQRGPSPRGEANPSQNNGSLLQLPMIPESTIARNDNNRGMPTTRGTPAGVLSDAIRNVQKYAGGESLQNVQGNGDFGPSIQFDTKGVEFGPWLRRFVAQIRRNWFVPYAAMSLHGHVVLTFNVHKDGSISDLQIMRPSAIDAFTNSASNAVKSSNPTMPLPPEYPDERAFFTVTFYFNETPPGGGH